MQVLHKQNEKRRTRRLFLFWSSGEYLAILESFSAPNYRADLQQGVAGEYVSCEPTESARELFGEDAAPGEKE